MFVEPNHLTSYPANTDMHSLSKIIILSELVQSGHENKFVFFPDFLSYSLLYKFINFKLSLHILFNKICKIYLQCIFF